MLHGTFVSVLNLVPALTTPVFLRRWGCWQCYLRPILLKLLCYEWFLRVPGSWSQERLRLECLITFPSYMASTTNWEAWLVFVSIGELHRKRSRTDAQSLHDVWACPHDFFQRAIIEIKTYLQKHLCEYPHWRTWEQKVMRAVAKITMWLTFGYGSRESCETPTACSAVPILVQLVHPSLTSSIRALS